MSKFIVVADAAHARIYLWEADENLKAGGRLVEVADMVNGDYTARGKDAPGVKTERNTSRQAGPMHPQGAKRATHRAEVERRFVREVADKVRALLSKGGRHILILSAEPHILGLMRMQMKSATGKRFAVNEISRNYTHLTPTRLLRQLVAEGAL
jgi:protein required for attachment to host cells